MERGRLLIPPPAWTTQPVPDLWQRALPAVQARVARATALARHFPGRVFAVGGLPRDLLLGVGSRDLDLTVVGDGLTFARQLAADLGAGITAHAEFATAEIADPELGALDVVTARGECYPGPARLPVVTPGPLEEDLLRRDFTVNCLAVPLDGEATRVLDYCHGLEGLTARELRGIHDRTFEHDPTRVLRGERLGVRLRFGWHLETARLAAAALRPGGPFTELSPARLAHELARGFEGEDPHAPAFFERLAAIGFWAWLVPELAGGVVGGRFAAARGNWAERAGAERGTLWQLLLAALAVGLTRPGAARLAAGLGLAGAEQEQLVSLPERWPRAVAALAVPGLAPHQAHAALARFTTPELVVMIATQEPRVAAWARRELDELRPLALQVRGRDLVARGVPPGPELGAALAAVHRARLDGEIGPEGELALALAHVGAGGRR